MVVMGFCGGCVSYARVALALPKEWRKGAGKRYEKKALAHSYADSVAVRIVGFLGL